MANPIKVVAGAAKAMRGKKNSKGLKATQYKDVKKLTTGRAKAHVRNVLADNFGVNVPKGKNKDWAKNANKSFISSEGASRRASLKEANWNNRIQKHPLVRNAGEAASESKYRGNRGKSVPVKKRGK